VTGKALLAVPHVASSSAIVSVFSGTIAKGKPREEVVMPSSFYVTSFCNFAHSLKTGRPIRHECITIPPRLLRAERDLPFDEALELWREWKYGKNPPRRYTVRKSVTHKGTFAEVWWADVMDTKTGRRMGAYNSFQDGAGWRTLAEIQAAALNEAAAKRKRL
jgi:hypothetical protein